MTTPEETQRAVRAVREVCRMAENNIRDAIQNQVNLITKVSGLTPDHVTVHMQDVTSQGDQETQYMVARVDISIHIA